MKAADNSEALSALLSKSAHECIDVAIRAFIRGRQWTVVAAQSGMAVELFAKAALAQYNPMLIADLKSPNQKVLYGLEPVTTTSAATVKTITGFEACKRIGWVSPGTALDAASYSEVLDCRNCACHLGYADETRATASLGLAIGLISVIVELIDGFNVPMLWYPNDDLAGRLRRNSHHAVAARVSGKISEAQLVYQSRVYNLPDDAIDTLIQALSHETTIGTEIASGAHAIRKRCPACDSPGWLICQPTFDDFDAEEDGDEVVMKGAHEIAIPLDYECHVCSLRLSRAELGEVGMAETIDLGWKR